MGRTGKVATTVSACHIVADSTVQTPAVPKDNWRSNLLRPMGCLQALFKWNQSSWPQSAPARQPAPGGRNYVWSQPPGSKISLFAGPSLTEKSFDDRLAPPPTMRLVVAEPNPRMTKLAMKAGAGVGTFGTEREIDLQRNREK